MTATIRVLSNARLLNNESISAVGTQILTQCQPDILSTLPLIGQNAADDQQPGQWFALLEQTSLAFRVYGLDVNSLLSLQREKILKNFLTELEDIETVVLAVNFLRLSLLLHVDNSQSIY